MGTISEFVIAEIDEGKAIGDAYLPKDNWPTLSGWKGIESIKLSTLYCSITGEEYSNDLQKSFEFVGGDKYEGPWVFLFPKKIQDTFSSVELNDIDAIAQTWVKTEELEMDRWSLDEAIEFITQIVTYAKKANDLNKSMFLWFSL